MECSKLRLSTIEFEMFDFNANKRMWQTALEELADIWISLWVLISPFHNRQLVLLLFLCNVDSGVSNIPTVFVCNLSQQLVKMESTFISSKHKMVIFSAGL